VFEKELTRLNIGQFIRLSITQQVLKINGIKQTKLSKTRAIFSSIHKTWHFSTIM